VAEQHPYERFSGLTYEAFRKMASDPMLTSIERSGFPESLRAGRERAILADVCSKLTSLDVPGTAVLDIGCGANPLTEALIQHCHDRDQRLTLVDSEEVLSALSDRAAIANGRLRLVAGRYPDIPELKGEEAEQYHAILTYSVFQYVFTEGNATNFIDSALNLLRPSGRLLVGDLPNSSMRNRFLVSDNGHEFHRTYTGETDGPRVPWPILPRGEIDDGVLFGIIARARAAGFHAWIVPQSSELPMANRREDLLCQRP
jgi:2-polyprenyl-3-methyl-5-hydroxy-6-metoxy-1,4-benzoquinol methylase